MTDWDQHLPDQTINAIRNGLIEAGLVNPANLDAMMVNVNNQFAATLPTAGLAPSIRLLTELQRMNQVHNLRNGEVPLKQWLDSAAAMASAFDVGTVIDAALIALSGQQTALADDVADRTVARSGDPLNTDIVPEAMIAGSDLSLSIKYLRGGVETSRSVFKLLVHRHQDGQPEFTIGDTPWLVNGTGWMIGPRLLITNHHVINARDRVFVQESDASEADFRVQAETMRVLYDYHEVDKPSRTQVTGPGALIASDKKLDFAILRLPADAEERPPLRLRSHPILKSLTQALGTRVNVIQHPNGDPMRVGFRDNFVTIGDKSLLAYLTDTSSGSSGSPVCDDGWTVAALHAGSQSVSDKNIVIRGKKVKKENFGTPMSAILAKLQTDDPNLHDEILAAHT